MKALAALGARAFHKAMTIEEALRRSHTMDVACAHPSCGAVTRVDLHFFASRRPLDTSLETLAKSLVCTGCGGDRVVIGLSTD